MPDERVSDKTLEEMRVAFEQPISPSMADVYSALTELQSRRQAEREAMVGAEEMAERIERIADECASQIFGRTDMSHEGCADAQSIIVEQVTPLLAPLYAKLARQAKLLGECREYIAAHGTIQLLNRIDAEVGGKGGRMKNITAECQARIDEAQTRTHYELLNGSFHRIPYGKETNHGGFEATERCHDCYVSVGQLHQPGCDWEQCPSCNGQVISCRCWPPEEEKCK